MNKEQLKNKLMKGIRESLNFDNEKTLNEARNFDPKNNKDHKAAYNSFVKWYNRWANKLDHSEMTALMNKVSNDARLSNLHVINEARVPARIEDADDHLAFDMFLTFENTRVLWENFGEAVGKMLVKKMRRGVELDEAYLADSSMIQKAAKATIDEYRRVVDGGNRIYISPSTRKALRAKIAHAILAYAQEEFDFEQNQ